MAFRLVAVGLIPFKNVFKKDTKEVRTLSCLKVKRPCFKENLHAPRIWGTVHKFLLQRKHEGSLSFCQRHKLLGDGNTLNVEEIQNDNKLGGNASIFFHDKLFLM